MKPNKAIIFTISIFIFGYFLLYLYNSSKYLNEASLYKDIKRRVEKSSNYDAKDISEVTIRKEKDIDNKRIIMYTYILNNTRFIACSAYENTSKGKYKFESEEGISMNTHSKIILTKDNKGKEHSYFIMYGIIADNDTSKFEITVGGKTFIEEYPRDNYFIKEYAMDNSQISIKPIRY